MKSSSRNDTSLGSDDFKDHLSMTTEILLRIEKGNSFFEISTNTF